MRRELVVLFSLAAAACSADDVVVATQAPPASTAPPPITGPVCASNDDCSPNAFCEKATCDAPKGTCILRPLTCEATGGRICGCDQLTYWNDCLRKQAGVAAATPGECKLGKPCASPADCGFELASCAKLFPPSVKCMPDLPGTCWVLPPICPTEMMMQNEWKLCQPGPPMMGKCSSTCEAIRDGAVYRHAAPNDPECKPPM